MFIKILLFVGLVPLFAIANGVGNGGDICENRFTIIRNDIQSWMLKGGGVGLNLPQGVSFGTYNQTMLSNISMAKISCTDEKIFIGIGEKTCMNFRGADGSLQINCNLNRFMDTSESDQYILVHHEYAGLSGLELNTAEASDYRISNQISYFLEDQIVKKLVIKPVTQPGSNDPFNPSFCQGETISDQDTLRFFNPGTIQSKNFDVSWQARSRQCHVKTGCSAWNSAEAGFSEKMYYPLISNPTYYSVDVGFSLYLDGSLNLDIIIHMRTADPFAPALIGQFSNRTNYRNGIVLDGTFISPYYGSGYLVLDPKLDPNYYQTGKKYESDQTSRKANLTGKITNHCLWLSGAIKIILNDGIWKESETVLFSKF